MFYKVCGSLLPYSIDFHHFLFSNNSSSCAEFRSWQFAYHFRSSHWWSCQQENSRMYSSQYFPLNRITICADCSFHQCTFIKEKNVWINVWMCKNMNSSMNILMEVLLYASRVNNSLLPPFQVAWCKLLEWWYACSLIWYSLPKIFRWKFFISYIIVEHIINFSQPSVL